MYVALLLFCVLIFFLHYEHVASKRLVQGVYLFVNLIFSCRVRAYEPEFSSTHIVL